MLPRALLHPKLGPLDIRFDVPDAGWIALHAPQFAPRWTIQCSEVDDPFPEFVDWLNAIAEDRSAIWRIGEEGSDSSFVFLARSFLGDDTSQLIYSWGAAGEIGQLTAAIVDTRRVVESFYAAFRSMISHPDYREREWEGVQGGREAIDDEEAYDRSYETNQFDGARLREFDWLKVETFLAGGVTA